MSSCSSSAHHGATGGNEGEYGGDPPEERKDAVEAGGEDGGDPPEERKDPVEPVEPAALAEQEMGGARMTKPRSKKYRPVDQSKEVHSVASFGAASAEVAASGAAHGGGTGDRWKRVTATNHDAPSLFVPKGSEAFASSGCRRELVHADALEWLREQEVLRGALFTSLPDVIELDMEGREEEYEAWFVDAAELAMSRLADKSVAIFYQTDVKVCASSNPKGKRVQSGMREGALMSSGWIDKSLLCQQAARRVGCRLLWRKVVVKGNIDAASVRRPEFTHLLCFGKGDVAYDTTHFAVPDLMPRGLMVWAKAIGVDAAMLGVRFLREVMRATHVTDPFCGTGTILAAANIVGLDAVPNPASRIRQHTNPHALDPLPLIPRP